MFKKRGKKKSKKTKSLKIDLEDKADNDGDDNEEDTLQIKKFKFGSKQAQKKNIFSAQNEAAPIGFSAISQPGIEDFDNKMALEEPKSNFQNSGALFGGSSGTDYEKIRGEFSTYFEPKLTDFLNRN